jgi:hypothetical protein
LLLNWADYIVSVGNILYVEGTNKLGYMESTNKGIYMEGVYSRIYTRGRNKVVYIEFTSCRCLVLPIAENRSAYALSKINIG